MSPAQGACAQLGTVIVFTRRIEEPAGWYRPALGLGEYNTSPGHLGQQVGGVYLRFDQDPTAEEAGHAAVTLWFTVDDLHATFERMVAMGAAVRYAPVCKPWGAELACVYDPDGNMIGLSQRSTHGA